MTASLASNITFRPSSSLIETAPGKSDFMYSLSLPMAKGARHVKSSSVFDALSSRKEGSDSDHPCNLSCDDTVHSGISFDETEGRVYSITKLIEERRWKQVERLVADRPFEAKRLLSADQKGESFEALPLHVLCILESVPMFVIKAVLDANPDAVLELEAKSGMLPIHLACTNRCVSVSMVEELLKVYPEGARVQSRTGDLPLHYAAKCGNAAELVALLLNVHPTATASANKEGNLPLHEICSRSHVDNNIVRLIMASNPRAIRVKNFKGQLPLHCACFWRNPTYVIAAMLHSYPESINVKDSNEQLPQDLLTSGRQGSCLYSLSSDPRFHILQGAQAKLLATEQSGKDMVQKNLLRQTSCSKPVKLQRRFSKSINNLFK